MTLVDTGFTGELKISSKEMLDLDIMPDRLEIVQLANGKDTKMFPASAEFQWRG